MTETARPTFFVVETTPSGLAPALYYDELPPRYRGRRAQANGLLYALRIDRLPHAELWLAQPLSVLWGEFQKRTAGGRVPASNVADPPSSAEKAKPLLGHRETFVRSWPALPPEPHPDPGSLQPKPEAGGFIGPTQIAESGE